MKRTTSSVVLLAAAAIALGSCSKQSGEAKAAADTKAAADAKASNETVFAVAVASARKGPISDYLGISGDLVAASTVDVFPDTAGKVTRLAVETGARVQKDQVLLEVDPSKPGMNFVPSAVKSPISGTIVSLPAQLGGTVAPQMAVAKISSTGSLEVRAYVAERFISKMRVGLRAELTLDAYPGRTFRATVRELSPVVDPVSRTLEVKLSIGASDAQLRSGMFAKVKVYTDERGSVVTVPVASVVRRGGESFLFVAEDGPPAADGAKALSVAKKRAVKMGILVDDRLEIVEGIEAGERVVMRGQTLLDEGSKINIVASSDATVSK
jgi:multidrug efflux pump subunit AcrA (membrane-fusion protein)